jgi:hypothetical protein
MLSRALSLATVTLLIGCFAAAPAQAQAQNLEAGKSPSQIFAGTCTACHKSPRGLLKSVPAGSLQGFLRQHYTTSPDMASLLSAYLISNGAADTRYGGAQPKPAKDAKSDARPSGPPEQQDRYGRRLRPGGPPQEAAPPEAAPREAAKPDADGLPAQAEPGRKGHNARRLARPGETPDGTKPAAEGQAPAQTATERDPDGRKLTARQKLTKRGKPGGEEPPKTDSAKTDAAKEEPPKGEAATDDKPKSETAKDEGHKPEGGKPAGEAKSESGKSESSKSESSKSESSKSESGKPEPGQSDSAKPESTKPETARPEPIKSESAKIEAPKETGSGSTPVLRADPVPPVTPAPQASAAVSGATPVPAATPSAPAVQPAPLAVTVSAPPPVPVAPAGPPGPPISQ